MLKNGTRSKRIFVDLGSVIVDNDNNAEYHD